MVDVETLRWLNGVGVVLEAVNVIGMRRQQFIERERIKHILISEVCLSDNQGPSTRNLVQVIGSSDVRFYLVFVLRDQERLTVAFEVNTKKKNE